MKVVVFCGGFGMRLREYSEAIPKPMVPIGYRPVLWHLLKYYAHFGHTDFILCLGYRADVVKDYFLNYDECVSNDFVLRPGASVELLGSDIHDWNITFVDTGMHASIGERLLAVRHHLEGEEYFLANYADGLCDLDLGRYLADFVTRDRVASFVSVRPPLSYHIAEAEPDGTVTRLADLAASGVRVNGGYFVFRHDFFDYIRPGEELVGEPFERLIRARMLLSTRHDGFWMGMDTFKDKQILDDLFFQGRAPWELWKAPSGGGGGC